jgi:hypothetical protein
MSNVMDIIREIPKLNNAYRNMKSVIETFERYERHKLFTTHRYKHLRETLFSH